MEEAEVGASTSSCALPAHGRIASAFDPGSVFGLAPKHRRTPTSTSQGDTRRHRAPPQRAALRGVRAAMRTGDAEEFQVRWIVEIASGGNLMDSESAAIAARRRAWGFDRGSRSAGSDQSQPSGSEPLGCTVPGWLDPSPRPRAQDQGLLPQHLGLPPDLNFLHFSCSKHATKSRSLPSMSLRSLPR